MIMHSIPVKPVGNKVLISPLPKEEEELNSGIIIPESVNAELREGLIVEVSDSVKDLYEIGQTVLYYYGKGVGQVFNGKAYLWLNTEPHLEEVWGIKK